MRKFKRFAVSFPITIQATDGEEGKGVAKNVSITGCCVESLLRPKIHSFMKLTIDLPSLGKINVAGIVLRMETFGFSLHFNWLDKDSLRKFGWYLYHLYPSEECFLELTSYNVEVQGLEWENKDQTLVRSESDLALVDGVVDELFRKSWASLIERSPSVFLEKLVSWSAQFFSPELEPEPLDTLKRPVFLGTSPVMQEILKKIRRFSTTSLPVLLMGETGVGKEMLARMIHDNSQYHDGPFVPVNCGAIPDTLFESLVFGHEKGSFTGAHAQQNGWLESSRDGTLFLDEIGEIPLSMQVKFLRVLQEKTFTRLGSSKEIPFESRIIAATNKNLKEEVQKGRFREDLFYRIEGLLIEIPPLRERLEDILPMADYFLSVIGREYKKERKFLSREAKQECLEYLWPGNIRELQNAICRAVIVSEGQEIHYADMGLNRRQHEPKPASFKEMVSCFERDILTKYLFRYQGNVTRVSEELKISRPSIYNMMKKYNITNDGRG